MMYFADQLDASRDCELLLGRKNPMNLMMPTTHIDNV